METAMHATNLSTALLAVAFGLAACASDPQSRSFGQVVEDQTLETRVKVALIDDPAVSAGRVEVETYKGVVQLSGTVGSEKEADAAVAAAKRVSGVTSVKNDLRVSAR
jgi:osmotically-inducible protein OsmY